MCYIFYSTDIRLTKPDFRNEIQGLSRMEALFDKFPGLEMKKRFPAPPTWIYGNPVSHCRLKQKNRDDL